MLLIISNLPKHMQYTHIKDLIENKCGVTEVILDNLISDGDTRRVTIGLADENDAAMIIQNLNGLLICGTQIYVEDVRQMKTTENRRPTNPMNERHQQPNKQNNNTMDMMQYNQVTPMLPPSIMPEPFAYNNMPYYMANAQDANINYNKQTPLLANQQQQLPFFQQNPSGFMYQQSSMPNPWNQQLVTSYPEKTQQSNSSSNMNRSAPQNQNNKRGVHNRDQSGGNNWRDDPKSGPSRGYEDRRDRGDRGNRYNDRYEDRNSRSNGRFIEHDSKSRGHERSPPRNRGRYDEQPDYRRGRNDFENSERNMRYERSPPRERSPHNRSNYERAMRERELAKNRDSGHRKPRNYGVPDQRHVDYERNDNRQSNYAPKKPTYNNTAKTFSSEPYNSTFCKQNANVGQQATKPSFFKRTAEPDIRGPPPKMVKLQNDGYQVHPNKPNLSLPKPNDAVAISARLKQQTVWRAIAANELAKTIRNSAKSGTIKNFGEFMNNLKKCVASRIDVVLGDKLVNSLDEMIALYRKKFSMKDDLKFFRAVLEKSKRDHQESPQQKPGAFGGPQKTAPGSSKQNINQMSGSSYAPKPTSKFANNAGQFKVPTQPPPLGKIPKYPNASKQEYKDQKKMLKLEFKELSSYTMEPDLQAAVTEEIDGLVKIFKETTSETNPDEFEDSIRQTISNDESVIENFARIIKVHLSRRLLDVKSHLIVRIFAVPKLPKKPVLDEALKDYGIVSLRKSDTKLMFLASLDSFENYDKLLELGTTTLADNITLHFKPLHLAGPVDKKTKQFKKSFEKETRFKELILPKGKDLRSQKSNENIKTEENETEGKEEFDNENYDTEEVFDEDELNEFEAEIKGELDELNEFEAEIKDELDESEENLDGETDFTCDELDFNLDDTQLKPGDSPNDSEVAVAENENQANDERNFKISDDVSQKSNDKSNAPQNKEENTVETENVDPVGPTPFTEDDLEDF